MPGMEEAVDKSASLEQRLRELRRGRRALLLFVFGAALASGLALYQLAGPERTWTSPADVAQRFLSDIKHGESADEKGRTGYERAYDLLSEDAKAACPWPDFLTAFVLPVRDWGPIQSSEASAPGVRRHRSQMNHAWVLYFGRSTRVHREDMERYLLTVRLSPEGESFAISGFALEPAP